jgi:hypothetical protein
MLGKIKERVCDTTAGKKAAGKHVIRAIRAMGIT